jgi:hypothetical protein
MIHIKYRNVLKDHQFFDNSVRVNAERSVIVVSPINNYPKRDIEIENPNNGRYVLRMTMGADGRVFLYDLDKMAHREFVAHASSNNALFETVAIYMPPGAKKLEDKGVIIYQTVNTSIAEHKKGVKRAGWSSNEKLELSDVLTPDLQGTPALQLPWFLIYFPEEVRKENGYNAI